MTPVKITVRSKGGHGVQRLIAKLREIPLPVWAGNGVTVGRPLPRHGTPLSDPMPDKITVFPFRTKPTP